MTSSNVKAINPETSEVNPLTGKEWTLEEKSDWSAEARGLCRDLTPGQLHFLFENYGGICNLINACMVAAGNGSVIALPK